MCRFLPALCLALSLSCPAQDLVDQIFGKKGGDDQLSIEVAYRRVKGAKAGVYLAKRFPGKKVLVLLPAEMPGLGGNQAEPAFKATLDGLRAGLGGKLPIVGVVEPKMPAAIKARVQAAMGGMQPGGMAMMPEGQLWFDVPALNKELAPFKGKYDLLVCLTSLPGTHMMPGMMNGKKAVGFDKLDFWLDPNVSVVLLEGGVNKFLRLIQVGKIIAAATYKQNITEEAYEKAPPRNLADAFNMRFVLITPENIAQHMSYFAH
jgi:hypothetical protein